MNYRLKFRIPFTYELEPEENQDSLYGDSLPSYKKTILIYVDSVSFDGTALIDQGRFEEQVDNAKNLTVYEKGVLKEAAYDWCLEDFEIVCINFSRPPEQCTGSEDMNGTLIYDEDIIEFGDEFYQIKYSDACFWIAQEDNAMELHTILGNDFYVVGNIHENPELLEGIE